MRQSIESSRHRPRGAGAPGASPVRGGGTAVGTTAGQWTWLDDWISGALAQGAGVEGEAKGGQNGVRQAARQRDAALRELAARYYPGLQRSAQANQIRRLTVHYATNGWSRDRRLAAPPPHYADSPHELLWCAFRAGAPLPIGERQLCRILRPPAVRPRPRESARARSHIAMTAVTM